MCMSFLNLENPETWSCSIVSVLTQNSGDCIVWGLQFVNCLSSNHQDLSWLSSMVKHTHTLRYFMVCELVHGKVLKWNHQHQQKPPEAKHATRGETG